nr:CfaE/CblD family pilus tip adhesin [Stenotrophomonas geniculata]
MALLLPAAGLAQTVPGPTEPASATYPINVAFDRSMPAPDTRLWPEELFVLGFDSVRPERQLSRLHFVCRSSSDTQNGACMPQGAPAANDVESEIPVRFTEERSGRTMDLRIRGHLRRVGSHRLCQWLNIKHGLQSNDPGNCSIFQVDGSGVSARLPGSELDKLMPGHWRASLILDLRSGTASPVLATYTFNFTVDVTDISGAAVYFPDRPVAIPRVGLNLRHSATIPATIRGEATLDMCLYDGRGSVSSYLELQVRDEGRIAPGRAPGMHSVYRRGGGEEAEDRIDFEALLNYEGAALPMNNGDTVMLHGTDRTRLRPVRLPGMLDTVYCVPAPLTLRTPPVNADSKSAGYYEGRLTVQMTVPTTIP